MTRLHIIAVALLAAGCGDHGGMDMMSDHAAVMDGHLTEASLALHHHQVAVEAARALDAIAVEEQVHAGEMAEHDLAMTHEMADMMGCMDRSSDAMDQMMGDMSSMEHERTAHVDRMTGMATLSDARAEEAAHQARMTALMADLDGHLTSMMDGADLSCPHHD